MTLIKSISGIRGTIGGKPGEGLSPLDIVKFTAAYGFWLKQNHSKVKVVIGRDARMSGEMVENIVSSTLIALGIDVVNIGLSTTPTVEVAVPLEKAQGGIILTASHNPKQWNALKLLNHKGEFISGAEGETILKIADEGSYSFVQVDDLGTITKDETYISKHIQQVIAHPLVNKDAIQKANFKVAFDAVNSTGGIVLPELLKALGVNQILPLFDTPNGDFPHNPEPLPEHLQDIAQLIKKEGADIGFVVDPDVDRLAMVCEDGTMFGEEYTLVAVADYILSKKKGNTVSNLSSTRALRDVTVKHGGEYFPAAVGEVNVVEKMKEVNAVIGGEGNGGIIFPDTHYGRDALIGIALFLSLMAEKKLSASALRASYPQYFISKNKIELTPDIDVDLVLASMAKKYQNENINTVDGVKIDFEKEWVHLRKSNTEPIIRIYSESENEQKANDLAKQIIEDILEITAQKA
ncbi:MAG: phosphomannomutase/phosphoglucomutase [Bacteroidota bacterium]|jgi:phosphomannomutase